MNHMQIHEYANSLLKARGDAAEAIAAQKARECRETGDKEQAKDWERIRASISSMRGPNLR